MASEIAQGDPKMFLETDGFDIKFVDGLPIMDTGFDNVSLISIGTENGYAGNASARNSSEEVGSNFIEESRKSITKNQLKVIEDAAERSYDWMIDAGLAERVVAEMEYVSSFGYELTILISPPVGPDKTLVYLKNGENWIQQQKKSE